MYKVIGSDGQEVAMTESFIEAVHAIHEVCTQPVPDSGKPINVKDAYIEASGIEDRPRMYYPYVFEFSIKTCIIKNGKLDERAIEPTIKTLTDAFNRASFLHSNSGMGCH
jgi:hypothetical protein